MSSKTLSVIVVAALMASAVPAMAGTISVSNPDNVLSPSCSIARSICEGHNSTHGLTDVARALDGLADDGTGDALPFLFAYHDVQQRLAISGFTVPDGDYIGMIRIYTISNTVYNNTSRNLREVTVKSSTAVKTSLNAADYETTLVTSYALNPYDTHTIPQYYGTLYAGIWNLTTGDAHVYFDVPISAPAGTKSLYFNFGDTYYSSARDQIGYPPWPGTAGFGDRIYELQALSLPIPEPASIALLTSGLLGLLCYAWRKRK